jgi:protein-S-isoprenylcysteine O-methyltransferase Ste14
MDHTLRVSLVRSIWAGCGFVLFLSLALFLAGGIDWGQAWVFVANFVVQAAMAGVYLCRVNPEIITARSRFHVGMKLWDKPIAAVLIVTFMLMFPTAGFDHRYHWSHVPTAGVIAGYLLLTQGMVFNVWVLSVNKFAEPGIRIQTERGHRVIDSGPYAIVRHPLYAATPMTLVGYALALGSYWAFLPAAISMAVLVARTSLEDRMLKNELPGYEDYARRVRYRLLRGVW